MIKTKDILPDKLSDLLELAVKDAKKIAKTPGYELKMGTYHSPGESKEDSCQVCLAGSVMACTLKAPKNKDLGPWGFKDRLEDKLEAIDCLRVGDWSFDEFMVDDGWNPFYDKNKDGNLANEAMGLIQDNFDDNLDGGRAPWDIYLKAAKMLRKAGF